MIPDLSKYKKNIYSQNGEDGVIEKLLDILDITCGWCCDVGAWEGITNSNVYNLIRQGWRGVLIEAAENRYADLLKTQQRHPDNIIAVRKEVIFLDEVLLETPIPLDFDVLNIDVDGRDYHIWKALKKYRPKIVIIEVSGLEGYYIQRKGALHKPTKSAPVRDPCGSTSSEAMKELAESKGYMFVVDVGNLIFVEHTLYKP